MKVSSSNCVVFHLAHKPPAEPYVCASRYFISDRYFEPWQRATQLIRDYIQTSHPLHRVQIGNEESAHIRDHKITGPSLSTELSSRGRCRRCVSAIQIVTSKNGGFKAEARSAGVRKPFPRCVCVGVTGRGYRVACHLIAVPGD